MITRCLLRSRWVHIPRIRPVFVRFRSGLLPCPRHSFHPFACKVDPNLSLRHAKPADDKYDSKESNLFHHVPLVSVWSLFPGATRMPEILCNEIEHFPRWSKCRDTATCQIVARRLLERDHTEISCGDVLVSGLQAIFGSRTPTFRVHRNSCRWNKSGNRRRVKAWAFSSISEFNKFAQQRRGISPSSAWQCPTSHAIKGNFIVESAASTIYRTSFLRQDEA